MAKRAVDQLHSTKQPHIVQPIPRGFPGWDSAPDASMVVSTPHEIDTLLRRVPHGRLITLDGVRGTLAARYGTTIACPVSTAIYINVVARAAEEQRDSGAADLTPYWRALKPGGLLNPKYPGGVEAQRRLLEAEGFTVVQGKGGLRVENFQDFLVELEA